jgi:hypothetical protein
MKGDESEYPLSSPFIFFNQKSKNQCNQYNPGKDKIPVNLRFQPSAAENNICLDHSPQ